MKLNTQTLILNLHRDPISGITLDLSSKSIRTLLPLLSLLPSSSHPPPSSYASTSYPLPYSSSHHPPSSSSSSLPPPDEIKFFLARYNYLKVVEDVFDYFGNLKVLDLSVNHISEMGNLKSLVFLEELNLSQNRISKIEGIDNLKKLTSLDLSHNYLEKATSLPPTLITLNLSSNSLRHLDPLPSSLTSLLLAKNKLTSLSALIFPPSVSYPPHPSSQPSSSRPPPLSFQSPSQLSSNYPPSSQTSSNPNLKILDMRDNEFNHETMDDLILGIKCLEGLEEVDFSGNAVSEGKEFLLKVMYFKNLKRINGLEVNGILKSHLEGLRMTNNYNDLFEKTKREVLERGRLEEEVNQEMRERLGEREDTVERIYQKYEDNMKRDLDEFLDFMEEYRRNPNGVDPAQIERWKSKIEIAEKERKRTHKINQKKLEDLNTLYVASDLKYLDVENSNSLNIDIEQNKNNGGNGNQKDQEDKKKQKGCCCLLI